MSYIFKIFDMDGSLHYELKYNPTQEPQFETIIGDQHVWLWDMFSGALIKDGSSDILYGGSWSITIERAEV
jgi:hypothetical protein